jgi:hypothetical protein
VTDARVYSLQGAKLYETEFILINRDHIIWLIPEEETEETNEGGGGGAE